MISRPFLIKRVYLFAKRAKRFSGEDGFDWKGEKLTKFEDEFERWDVIATLEKADGLGIDADFGGEGLTADGTLCAENGYAVTNHNVVLQQYYIVNTKRMQL
jgi:hypothetical protein